LLLAVAQSVGRVSDSFSAYDMTNGQDILWKLNMYTVCLLQLGRWPSCRGG